MDLEIAGAFCFMPLLMVIAAQGWTWMICVFICLPLFFILYYFKVASKSRTRLFFGWSLVSFFFLLGIFELEVVPYLEILFIENFVLMCFVACMCLCVFFAKSHPQSTLPIINASERSLSKTELHKKIRCEICSCVQPARTYHCDKCGVCVHRRDHHSIWLDTCIGSRNQKYFIGALVALLLSCFYSSNLTLTTICHPTLLGGLLLIPDDCSDVFGDIHIAICFVSAVYTLMIAALGVFLFFQQLWLVSHNMTFQEWKQGQKGLYSNGCFRNLWEFFRGYT